MNSEKHSANTNRRTGLTLVEVIVVAAIIVLVIGFAVPGIVSLASLGRGDFGNSARNLYGALRTAKMYSSTHRAITAVAYVYTEVGDSVILGPGGDPAPVHVINGFSLVRKPVDRQDALRLAQSWVDDPQFNATQLQAFYGALTTRQQQIEFVADHFIDEDAFFTLQSEEGNFREFGRDAVILNAVPKTNEALTLAEVRTHAEQRGFRSIRIIAPWFDRLPMPSGDGLPDFVGQPVYDDTDDDGTPESSAPTNLAYLGDPGGYIKDGEPLDMSVWAEFTAFPSHVFAPEGRVLMPAAAAERVVLEVGPSPDLADAYRFSRELSAAEAAPPNEADETGLPLSQAELSIGRRFLSPVLIELYQTTGRVQASDGV